MNSVIKPLRHEPRSTIDETDRRIIAATQEGLPLVSRPYHELAESLGLHGEDVMQRMVRMRQAGVIRRIGAVPNHYKLGYTANGMSVWNVPDDQIDRVGGLVGALPFVSHCYRRPRHLPEWPYNLFAMVHGRSKAEVLELVDQVSDLLGESDHGHEVLFSKRILKKTGLRI